MPPLVNITKPVPLFEEDLQCTWNSGCAGLPRWHSLGAAFCGQEAEDLEGTGQIRLQREGLAGVVPGS